MYEIHSYLRKCFCQEGTLIIRAHGGKYFTVEAQRDMNCGLTHAPSTRMNQNALPFFNLTPHNESHVNLEYINTTNISLVEF